MKNECVTHLYLLEISFLSVFLGRHWCDSHDRIDKASSFAYSKTEQWEGLGMTCSSAYHVKHWSTKLLPDKLSLNQQWKYSWA